MSLGKCEDVLAKLSDSKNGQNSFIIEAIYRHPTTLKPFAMLYH